MRITLMLWALVWSSLAAATVPPQFAERAALPHAGTLVVPLRKENSCPRAWKAV